MTDELATELASALASALSTSLGAVTVTELRRLSGGASRETWSFDAIATDGTRHELILRRDPPGRPGEQGSMGREARSIDAAAGAGLAVPEVLIADDGTSLWGAAGLVMRRVPGQTLAPHILRDDDFAHARSVLVRQCGEFLAGLHALGPDAVGGLATVDALDGLRQRLADTADIGTSATFDMALAWLDAHRPPPRPVTLLHGDFRLGNLIVDADGLRAVLDWELVHLGEPGDDLGWICTKAWRFGSRLPAAGVGQRDELLDAYRAAGGVDISLDELQWWEVLNTLKWGAMCQTMASAHLNGAERSIELAAIGRRVCEQEWDLLLLLAPDAAAAAREGQVEAVGTVEPNGHGRPTAADLVEALGEFLTGDVMAATTDRVRFHARVAANVAAMVRREIELGPPPPLGPPGSEVDLDALARHVAHKVAVANPKHLHRT
ncbi:phosphotransferase [Desertimonas flava]|jgi:aminoglycoside phosphotransferase (APT) family kinase protein|uniref:phosphotransferase n=1 Tax=Desertimonas flava TaxID=2064846 RepID=UPI000E342661|nr:phosphotransferase [Desertimonas flava]